MTPIIPAYSRVTRTDAEVAGHLLALAESGREDIVSTIVREAARLCVTRGIAYAEGFVTGAWHVLGNRRDERYPHSFWPTWQAALSIFDGVIADDLGVTAVAS